MANPKEAVVVDPEILQLFRDELHTLKAELDPMVEKLKANIDVAQCFNDFSNIIDRIYGTAATLGFKELAEYTGMLKQLSRKCFNAKNLYAMEKTKELIIICVLNMERMEQSLHDPRMIRQMKLVFDQELQRGLALGKILFSS